MITPADQGYELRQEPLPQVGAFYGDAPQSLPTATSFRFLIEQFAPISLILADGIIWLLALAFAADWLQNEFLNLSSLILPPLAVTLTLWLIGGYDRRTDFMGVGYVSEHLIGIFAAAIISTFLAYVFCTFNQAVQPSRAFIPTLIAMFTPSSLYIRRVFGAHLQKQWAKRSILILGADAEAQRFYRAYNSAGLHWNLEFVNPFEDRVKNRIDGINSPLVHTDVEAKLAVSGRNYEAVLLACETAHLAPSVLQRLVALHCSNVPVLTVDAFHEKQWRRVSAESVGSKWLFDCEFRLAQGSVYSHVKRLFDVLVSATALILLSPFLLLAFLIIRVESSGAAIFRQERVGRNGRIFMMYKLRTMRENAGNLYTQEGDTRITRFGRWLRLMRLDELPQLWNVLIGDMSLIGPRAEWTKLAEIYEREIPNYHLRHLVMPGITGWAQVCFNYGASKEDTIEKFQFDLYYIRHFSLKLDISIALKTIHVMICGKGR